MSDVINIKDTKAFDNAKKYLTGLKPSLDSLDKKLTRIGSNTSGELRTFYNNRATSVKADIANLNIKINNAVGHIDSSLSVYYLADEKLLSNLNEIYDYIFDDYNDNTNIGGTNKNNDDASLEGRMGALRNYIEGLTEAYNKVHEQYTKLYGKGVPFDRQKVNEMVHLFDALGAFDNMNNGNTHSYEELFLRSVNGRPSNGFETEGDYQFINPDVWNYFLDFNNKNKVIDKLKSYFYKNKSWSNSGLEKVFGDNLRNKWQAYGDYEKDAETIFLTRYFAKELNNTLTDPLHQHGENDDLTNANRYTDFYFYIGKQKIIDSKIDDLNDWLERWDELDITLEDFSYIPDNMPKDINPASKEGIKYIINYLSNTDVDKLFKIDENGNYVLGSISYNKEDISKKSSYAKLFNLDSNRENSAYLYDEIIDKNNLLKYFKGYIRNQDIFTTYDQITQKKEECEALRDNDIELAQGIYSLKQMEKLLPFNEEMNNPEYQKYLDRKYNETNGRLKLLNQEELALYYYLKDKKPSEASKYLKAMDDTLNVREGQQIAIEYVKLLNSGHATADEIKKKFGVILGSLADAGAFIQGMTLSGTSGFTDGLYSFVNGLYNCVASDGVMSAYDYAIMFKGQLMVESNEYNKNIPNTVRDIYHANSQIMNRLGNYAIPAAVSILTKNPYAGRALMTASMFGNTLEGAKSQGYSNAESYLYAGSSAIATLILQSQLGNLPGIGQDITAKLVGAQGLDYVKQLLLSSARQGGVSMIYSYLDMGLKAGILGEEVDFTKTTGDALQNAFYAAAMSCILNGGKSFKIKYANGKVKTIDFKTAGAILDFEKNAGSGAEIVGIEDVDGKSLVTIRTSSGEELVYRFENINSDECLKDINRTNFLANHPEYSNLPTDKIDTMAQFKSMDIYNWLANDNSALTDISSISNEVIGIYLKENERMVYDSSTGKYYLVKLGESIYDTTTADVTNWVDKPISNALEGNTTQTPLLTEGDKVLRTVTLSNGEEYEIRIGDFLRAIIRGVNDEYGSISPDNFNTSIYHNTGKIVGNIYGLELLDILNNYDGEELNNILIQYGFDGHSGEALSATLKEINNFKGPRGGIDYQELNDYLIREGRANGIALDDGGVKYYHTVNGETTTISIQELLQGVKGMTYETFDGTAPVEGSQEDFVKLMNDIRKYRGSKLFGAIGERDLLKELETKRVDRVIDYYNGTDEVKEALLWSRDELPKVLGSSGSLISDETIEKVKYLTKIFSTKEEFENYLIKNRGYTPENAEKVGGVHTEEGVATFLQGTIKHVMVHEGNHECGHVDKYNPSTKSWEYKGTNEALTEAFSHYQENKSGIIPERYIAYRPGTKGINELFNNHVPGLTVDDFRRAYYVSHDLSAVKTAMDSLMGDGYFNNTFSPAMDKILIGSGSTEEDAKIAVDKVIGDIVLKAKPGLGGN